ncbi:MAG: hypothetical protein IT167_29100 [Bryobacterales bacterium]|nr:hypothetical protein [Bryobacterales bacterium]
MVVVTASDRKALSIPLNGAEYLELDAKSSAIGLSLPAYLRTCCGLAAWIARGREMGSRARPASRHPTAALERMTVTAVLTRNEHAGLEAQAREAGTTVPQYIRTRCGFEVRNTSLPDTPEREREEDDAWVRLQLLGLDPQDFFPPGA